MQFTVISALFFATLAAANIAPPVNGNPPPTIPPSKCPSGHLKCCQSAPSPSAAVVAPFLKKLGIPADSITGYVGINCNAISTGAGTPSCSAQPLCCTNDYDGISIGCNKVNLQG